MNKNNDEIRDILAGHNLEIKEAIERVSKLEQRANIPIYAAISPDTVQAMSDTIATQVLRIIENECVLPDPDLTGVEESIKQAAEAGVIHALDYHTIRIENKTVHSWPDSLQTTMNSLMVLLKKNIETGIVGWKKKLQELAAWGFGVLVTGCFIIGCIYFNSPQYWGTRYYKVCKHPLQKNEKLIERQYCAYEDVITFFDKGESEKQQMKAHIKAQEQELKRHKAKKDGENNNGFKP